MPASVQVRAGFAEILRDPANSGVGSDGRRARRCDIDPSRRGPGIAPEPRGRRRERANSSLTSGASRARGGDQGARAPARGTGVESPVAGESSGSRGGPPRRHGGSRLAPQRRAGLVRRNSRPRRDLPVGVGERPLWINVWKRRAPRGYTRRQSATTTEAIRADAYWGSTSTSSPDCPAAPRRVYPTVCVGVGSRRSPSCSAHYDSTTQPAHR
jgi:hypothetical protein